MIPAGDGIFCLRVLFTNETGLLISDKIARYLRVKPNWLPALRITIASNAVQGQAEEAKRALDAYIGIDPNVSITEACEYYPLR